MLNISQTTNHQLSIHNTQLRPAHVRLDKRVTTMATLEPSRTEVTGSASTNVALLSPRELCRPFSGFLFLNRLFSHWDLLLDWILSSPNSCAESLAPTASPSDSVRRKPPGRWLEGEMGSGGGACADGISVPLRGRRVSTLSLCSQLCEKWAV